MQFITLVWSASPSPACPLISRSDADFALKGGYHELVHDIEEVTNRLFEESFAWIEAHIPPKKPLVPSYPPSPSLSPSPQSKL